MKPKVQNQEYPHLRINHALPVREHSFLPADRVFGRIEQDIRRTPTILFPEEYYEILRRHGNLHCYLEGWQSYDFKSATKGTLSKAEHSSSVKPNVLKSRPVGLLGKEHIPLIFTPTLCLRKAKSGTPSDLQCFPQSHQLKQLRRQTL
ncbi:4-diphosphocytidyl-2-c-methyl-d-erythritol kinase [Plakobranchus ocellatus]|uniref:4-diphosphocytidyl-2-c-methyl-d-erythritol kinase n=1 Tax=Plakobranchus ocellatus TaxID=259542 RepID=A0AAV4CJM4_9GAST|nr:4-diphosphocytidyl-2-c-methyl-d-erythritol kinase [Plakobranchus ocellatus]